MYKTNIKRNQKSLLTNVVKRYNLLVCNYVDVTDTIESILKTLSINIIIIIKVAAISLSECEAIGEEGRVDPWATAITKQLHNEKIS